MKKSQSLSGLDFSGLGDALRKIQGYDLRGTDPYRPMPFPKKEKTYAVRPKPGA